MKKEEYTKGWFHWKVHMGRIAHNIFLKQTKAGWLPWYFNKLLGFGGGGGLQVLKGEHCG